MYEVKKEKHKKKVSCSNKIGINEQTSMCVYSMTRLQAGREQTGG